MSEALIYDCLRTPRARAKDEGTLKSLTPEQLVTQLSAGLKQTCGEFDTQLEQLILGCVGQVGDQGGNVALSSRLHAGLPDKVAAYALNNYCVSGLTAVANAANAINAGAARLVLAGGVEHMSRVPFLGDKARYYTDTTLPARRRFLPIPVAADLLATANDIDRQTLDEITAQSHQRAAAAVGTGLNRSLFAMRAEDGSVLLDRDECIRPQTDADGLAALEPGFADFARGCAETIDGRALDHRHSFANAPPMVDGAALALLGAANTVDRAARARIVASVETAADPAASLTGGFAAMEKVLARAGMALGDMDRIEFMEAFAVVPALLRRDFDIDPARVNVGGGHLAKGHPLGATGAILLSSLLDSLDDADGTLGMVVATGASGIGAAMVVERLSR